MDLNKEISTLVAILIIVIVATLVGGIFYWEYSRMRKIEVLDKKLEFTKEQRLENDISDWATYSDQKSGFGMKYPESWHTHIKDSCDVSIGCSRRIVFSNLTKRELQRKKLESLKNDDYILLVDIIEEEKEEWFEYNKKLMKEAGAEIVAKKKVTVGKEEGYRIIAESEQFESVLTIALFNNGRTYMIETLSPKRCRAKKCEFSKRMLSTFEFID